MKKLLFSLLLAISTAAFGYDGESISTAFGQVIIDINKISIHGINGDHEIPIEKNIMTVYVKDKFVNKAEDAIILFFIKYTGRPECPAYYFIYEMSGASEDKQSQVFGTCSDQATIRKEDSGATITMIKPKTNIVVTYKYENGLIEEFDPSKTPPAKTKVAKK